MSKINQNLKEKSRRKIKMKKKITGMFWHCHHDELCEYVYDYQGRVDFIKNNKPKKEIKTRLKLFKKVKGKLPKELVEAWKKYDEAREKCDEAREKWDEAREKWDEAVEKYVEAREKYNEAREKYKLQIEKLHKKECGCKEWNGEEIIFEEKN